MLPPPPPPSPPPSPSPQMGEDGVAAAGHARYGRGPADMRRRCVVFPAAFDQRLRPVEPSERPCSNYRLKRGKTKKKKKKREKEWRLCCLCIVCLFPFLLLFIFSCLLLFFFSLFLSFSLSVSKNISKFYLLRPGCTLLVACPDSEPEKVVGVVAIDHVDESTEVYTDGIKWEKGDAELRRMAIDSSCRGTPRILFLCILHLSLLHPYPYYYSSLIFHFLSSPRSPPYFLLSFFFFSGQGIGARLVQAALDFCRQEQYRRVVLSTSGFHTVAQHMYRKHGFRLVATHHVMPFQFLPVSYFVLDLV